MTRRGLFGALATGIERKAVDISALTWEKLLGEPSSKAGVAVHLLSAARVTSFLACGRVRANGLAQVPCRLMRLSRDGKTREAAIDHPLYKLLYRRPNEWQTSFEFRQLMQLHVAFRRNAYAYIGWGGVGEKRRVVEIIPLCGHVEPKQDVDYTIKYDVSDKHGKIATLPRDNVLHIRDLSLDGVSGMDAVDSLREALGLAIAAEEAHAALHARGAKPGGLIAFDGKIAPETRDRLRKQLEASVHGLRNAFKTMILDQGAKWTPFAMTGVDSQHLETRRFQIEEVCRGMNVFPQMIGHTDKTATFASAEAFFQAHVTHTMAPDAENWRQALARDLFPNEDDLYVDFAMQSLLRGDHKTRAEFYAAGIVNGYFTRNEVRGWEDLNPIDGLDEPLIPLNLGTQEEREALTEEVAAAVKTMLGGNGGPPLTDDEIRVNVAGVLAAFNSHRRLPAEGARAK